MRYLLGFCVAVAVALLVHCGEPVDLCADCDDSNECTEDVCDPSSGKCSNVALADGTDCDFGGFAGVCVGGVCRDATKLCPVATVTTDPQAIPSGFSQTDVFVEVSNPNPENGLEVITELTSDGTIADPFARETTFTCAHDLTGAVQICVNAKYAGGGTDGGVPDGGMPEAGVSLVAPSEKPNIGASHQYLAPPHVRIPDPLECSETRCTTVICPDVKNLCPVVSSLTVEPMAVPEGGTATITVVAEDPDDNPEPLVTTLQALHGTIADPNAFVTTFTCDPDIGGAIQICVVANDGSCEVQLCTFVLCPSEPPENTCPIIEAFTADPNPIPAGETTTTVRVDAVDPDEFPEPLRTKFSSATGVFVDRGASETTFRCGAPGPVGLFVEATDGDPECDQAHQITVECPSIVPPGTPDATP